MTNLLQRIFVLVVHFNEPEVREIIASLNASKMCFQVTGKRVGLAERARILCVGEELDPILFEDRLFGGKRSRFLILIGQFAGFNLAGFDVRLVKSVDADDRAGNSSSNFPAEEFLAEIVGILNSDTHSWLPGLLERSHLGILISIGRRFESQIREYTIVAVSLRRGEPLTVNWDDSTPLLTGGLGKQLFEPCAEIGNCRRSDNRDFVAAGFCGRAQNDPKHHARVFLNWNRGGTGLNHLFGTIEKLLDIKPHDCGWNNAEIRQRRVAAANAGQAVEDVAEVIGLRFFFEL